jgi:outer membrane protein TolC
MFEDDYHLSYEVPPEQLEQIDPIDLEEIGVAPPITVERAAQQVLEQIVQPSGPENLREVAIGDVRAAVLTNNLDLQVQLVNPTIAATSVDEEEARFEATFTASARRTKLDTPTALVTEGNQITTDSYNVGLEVPLRTGGTINIDVPYSKTDTDNPFAAINPAYDADVRFSISQPLLRNAGARTNLHPIRVARGQEQITGAQTKLEAIRILASADRAYWSLYAARLELDVRLEEYKLAMDQLETAQRRVEAGDAPGIEITRARSGVADTLQGIIIAETDLRRAERDLKRLMNVTDLPINSSTRLVPVSEPDPEFVPLEADVLSAYAIVNRMEMLELELQLAIDASTIDFERNQALPLFVVDYTYNIGGLDTTRNDAFGQIADRSFEDHVFGLRAEIPIGNGAAKARVHRAILTRLQRLATREQRELAIRQEVYDALDTLEESWQRILAARLASRLAGETYEAEQRQFDVGLRTSTDVLDASTRLSDAQSSEGRALADFEIARIDLAFATGTLLGQQRVRWQPIDYEGETAMPTTPAVRGATGAEPLPAPPTPGVDVERVEPEIAEPANG